MPGSDLTGPIVRYVVISLSFDIQGADRPTPWIQGWRCVYELKTREFSIPADFAVNNTKALKTPGFDRD
jgi:hypothetical protein